MQIPKLIADSALGMDHNLLPRIYSDVSVNVNDKTAQGDGVERDRRAAREARAVGRICRKPTVGDNVTDINM